MANTKITSDNLDTNIAIAGTLGVTGVVTANAGVVVDNITIDGTEIDLSSGSLTIDAHTDIILDADSGVWRFKDDGTTLLQFAKDGATMKIYSAVSDADIMFQGNDGGSTVNALTLDMSAAGTAIFNNDIGLGAAPSATDWGSATRVLQITGTQPLLSLKDTDTGEFQIANSGQNLYFYDAAASVTRMFIKSDGTVHIGGYTDNNHKGLSLYKSTNAAYTATGFNTESLLRLHVPNAEGNYAGITYTHAGGTEYFTGLVRNGATADITDYVFQGYNGNSNAYQEFMRISSAGNLGIGTASPAQSLDTTGKIRIRDGGNTTVPSIQMGASGANGLSLPATNTVAFISNSLEAFRIDAGQSFNFNNNNNGARYFIVNQKENSDGGFILRVGNANKWQNAFNSAGQLSWYSYTAAATVFTMHGNGHVSILGSRVDRGAALNIGGTSGTARVIPQTDNVGYVGEAAFRWQAIYAVNGSIQTSDEREKTEIKETTLGLDFIKDLKPVSYKWIDGEQQDKGKDEREHQGLLAQQVAETVEKHGVNKNDFGGLDIQKTEKYDDFHGMSYDQFVAPLIKAIQEQQTVIEDLKLRIETLEE